MTKLNSVLFNTLRLHLTRRTCLRLHSHKQGSDCGDVASILRGGAAMNGTVTYNIQETKFFFKVAVMG